MFGVGGALCLLLVLLDLVIIECSHLLLPSKTYPADPGIFPSELI